MHRRLPGISVTPTLVTLGNLVAGFAAIHYAAKPHTFVAPLHQSALAFAAMLIFLGILLDAIDGGVARLVRSTSELGAELDSLADVITFGLAPAFVTLRLAEYYLRDLEGFNLIAPDADSVLAKLLWGGAALYVCCAALRLARFNTAISTTATATKRMFQGMPSPAAAGTVAGLILLHQHLLLKQPGEVINMQLARAGAIGIPMVMVICALAMVSTIPYTHFANRYLTLRGPRSFGFVARILVILILLILYPRQTVAVGFLIYAISPPLAYLSRLIGISRPATAAATAIGPITDSQHSPKTPHPPSATADDRTSPN